MGHLKAISFGFFLVFIAGEWSVWVDFCLLHITRFDLRTWVQFLGGKIAIAMIIEIAECTDPAGCLHAQTHQLKRILRLCCHAA